MINFMILFNFINYDYEYIMKPQSISKEILEQLYFDENKTLSEIATIFGYTSYQSIRNLFIKYDIKIRTKKESRILSQKLTDEKIPSKEQLEQLYFVENKSLSDIAHLYGVKSHTPIRRLFNQYNIKIRDRDEGTKIKHQSIINENIPSKEILEKEIQQYSKLELARRYNVHRSRINKWIEIYGLKKIDTKNYNFKKEILQEEDNLSPKELAIKHNVSVNRIKRVKNDFNEKLYSIEEIKCKIKIYDYDISNRGFPKQLYYDDINLYKSIIHHTKDHRLDTNKITEKLYRILNDFTPKDIICCKFCDKQLSFYNIKSGYGCSEIKICSNCLAKHNGFGVSRVSQKLFWKIYDNLNQENKNKCYFNDLNKEVKIKISNQDKNMLNTEDLLYLNKNRYNIDFILENKIIEFDGEYWHKIKDSSIKDMIKDKFLQSKGFLILRIPEMEFVNNSQETIEKCLKFLTH